MTAGDLVTHMWCSFPSVTLPSHSLWPGGCPLPSLRLSCVLGEMEKKAVFAAHVPGSVMITCGKDLD